MGDPLRQNLPYTGVVNPTLEECPSAAGTIYNPDNGLDPVSPYVPPDLCVGEWEISQGECGVVENTYQEELAEQALSASGAPVNIFKLLGIHEQGKMIGLAGNGSPLGSSDTSSIFDSLITDNWESTLKGIAVVSEPAYIGYDFGIKKTSFGQPTVVPGAPAMAVLQSFKISQPVAGHRALQVRIDSSDGGFFVNEHKIVVPSTNIGNGFITNFQPGINSEIGTFMLFAEQNAPDNFVVSFSSATRTQIVGIAKAGHRFKSLYGSFDIVNGSILFEPNDSFAIPVEMQWQRVDIVNLPNVSASVTIQVRQAAPARYWRIVPVIFQGVTNPTAGWIVGKVELFNVGEARLDVVQDLLFMENRDRDYASTALQLKAAYTPFDAVSDLSKFGFQIADIYTFTTTFASMVKTLGRPIVVGDVLELPRELQYDHNLKPVRKFLEVTDTGWSADGYTTGWKPIIFKFQAQQLIPGQEHQDLFGNVSTQKFVLSDDNFFDGLQQIQTQPLTATEAMNAEAVDSVPRQGAMNREFASGQSMAGPEGSYDGTDYSVEDGLPPDGQPYTTGFKLPDPAGIADRAFFRLEYEPSQNIPARLYMFSLLKNKWIYIETDRRQQRSAHSKNQRRIFDALEKVSPTANKV